MPKLSQTTAQNCIAKKQRLCLQLLVLLFYFTLEDRHIFPSNILFWFIISTSRSVHPIVAVFQSLSYILLCNPTDYSPPGFPVLHYLPEFLRFMSTESVMLSTISSSAVLFFCLHSFLASRSFPVSQVFASDSQSIGASSSASVLPVDIQGWFPWGLTGLISLLSEELSRVFSSTIIWKHPFLGAQLSLWSSSYKSTWLPEKP